MSSYEADGGVRYNSVWIRPTPYGSISTLQSASLHTANTHTHAFNPKPNSKLKKESFSLSTRQNNIPVNQQGFRIDDHVTCV